MSQNLLLTVDELVAITGYRRPRDQVAWISEHYAIRAFVNAAGEAVVLRAHLETGGSMPRGPNPNTEQRVRMVREVAP